VSILRGTTIRGDLEETLYLYRTCKISDTSLVRLITILLVTQ
jgi:hypothetical protein